MDPRTLGTCLCIQALRIRDVSFSILVVEHTPHDREQHSRAIWEELKLSSKI